MHEHLAHHGMAGQFLSQGVERQFRDRQDRFVQKSGQGLILFTLPEPLFQPLRQSAAQRPHEHDTQHIERGMEQGQGDRRVRRQLHAFSHPHNKTHQPRQEQQGHGTREHIEQHVGQGGALCIGRGTDARQRRCHSAAHVGTDHHRGRALRVDQATLGCGQGDGHGRTGRLHHHGHHQTHQQLRQQHQRALALRQAEAVRQATKRRLQKTNAQKQQTKARQSRANGPTAAVLPRHAQQGTHANHGQRQGLDLELQAHQRHDPAGHAGAHVGTKHHPHRRPQGQQASVDKTNRRHAHRRGRLHQRGEQNARPQSLPTGPGGQAQDVLKRRPGRQLQAIGHHGHAQQKYPQSAQQRGQGIPQAHG